MLITSALCFLVLTQLVAFASAQTLTTTDQFGQSIIEVVSTNSLANALTTSIISTIPRQTSSSTSTSTSTTPDVQQGPVGAPAATLPNQPIPYHYTTTNAQGLTTVLFDTFTPSFPATVLPPPTFTGSVLNFNSWQSAVGTNTVPVGNTASERWKISDACMRIGAGLGIGLMGGMWLTLA